VRRATYLGDDTILSRLDNIVAGLTEETRGASAGKRLSSAWIRSAVNPERAI
jgi:hypothetical protein